MIFLKFYSLLVIAILMLAGAMVFDPSEEIKHFLSLELLLLPLLIFIILN